MKNSKRNIQKRHEKILVLLQKEGTLRTETLSEKLNISLSTIRRDLNILEERNDIIKEHGYSSFNYNNSTNFDETGPEVIKQAIGREAAKMVHNGETIFINSSSTALNTVDYFQAKYLTIISNNMRIIHKKHQAENTYLLTGGELRFPKDVLVGDIAAETIAKMNADTCIIGCSGVSLENGITTENINEAKINTMMINQTFKRKILVADHRKIDFTSRFKVSELELFDYLITDRFCSKIHIKEIEKIGIKVIQVV